MLLHIRPRLLLPHRDYAVVALFDLRVEPFGLYLDQRDLATRRPYPNKRYLVACRRLGRAAVDGVLLETGERCVDQISYIARWSLDAEAVVTHRVDLRVLDEE